jgi:hypothetical protein
MAAIKNVWDTHPNRKLFLAALEIFMADLLGLIRV